MSKRLQVKRYHYWLRLVFCAMLFLSHSLVAQYTSVVDGYDNKVVAISAQLSFAPQQTDAPIVHYLSRRHLRELRLYRNISARTFPHATNPNTQFLRWKYPSFNSTLPVIADYDFSRTTKIELKNYDGEQWRRVLSPPVTISNFDFLLPEANDLSNVEWAFLQGDYVQQGLIILHATQRMNVFALDTLGFLPGLANVYDPNQAMILLRHGDAGKSIAITTGRNFNVFFWGGANWQQHTVTTNTLGWGDVYGGTLGDGTPFWLMRHYWMQLRGNQLVADSLEFLPTSGPLVCRALYQDEQARVHAVYVVSASHEFSYFYVQYNAGAWSIEKIPLPSRFYAFALSTQRDTVLLAYSGSNGEVKLTRRSAPAEWNFSLLDRAGDVGNDVAAAFDAFENRVALAYYDRTNGDLKVAHGASNARYFYAHDWFALRVDSVGNVGRMPAAFWRHDTLHAIYLDDTRGLLQHGQHVLLNDSTFGDWQVETVDSVGETQTRHAIAQSEDGTLRVAYSSARTEEIRLATQTQGVWQVQRFPASERPDTPGEISLFFHAQALKVGYVRGGLLRLGTQEGGSGEWRFAAIPSLAPAVYAVWATDPSGHMHVVYRARRGFQDEIRHLTETGIERLVTTTVTNDMRLRLRSIADRRILVLALVDDSAVKLFCYAGENWQLFLNSTESASEAGFDFLSAVYGGTYMIYRNPVPRGNPLPSAFSADLISEFWPGVIDAVEQREVAESVHARFAVFPNPFNAATRIMLSFSNEAESTVMIHNVLGQVVRKYTLSRRFGRAQTIVWDGNDDLGHALASGVYLLRLNQGARSWSQKVVLLR